MRLRAVVNPRAGGGTAARKISELGRELARARLGAEIVATTGPEHATELASQAFRDRVNCLMVVGGDGTVSEVCQAYLSSDERVDTLPRLALIPAGTGSDLCKTLGLSGSIPDAVDNVVGGAVRSVDLGAVELVRHDGAQGLFAFVNVTSFGLGGLTDLIVNRGRKWMGGRVTFFLGALRALYAYRNIPVVVRVDGQDCLEAPVLNVAIANGRYFGGGMKIAPDADPSDGLLDVVAVYDLTRAQGLGLAHRIYRGTHVGCPGVRVARGRVVEAIPVRAGDEVLIDLDGQTPGRLPLSASVLPGVLRICVPRPAGATSARA